MSKTSDGTYGQPQFASSGNTPTFAADLTLLSDYFAGRVQIHTVASLSALNTLATAKVGDFAIFSAAPGTGITHEGMLAVAISGTGASVRWRIVTPVVAASKANLDAFIAAMVAIADLNTGFTVGGIAYVAGTNLTYAFSSTAGAYGLLLVNPRQIVRRTATAISTGSSSYANISTTAAWAAIANEVVGFAAYSNGIVIPITGLYRVEWSIFAASGNGLAGININSASLSNAATLRALGPLYLAGATIGNGSETVYLTAGDTLRLWGYGSGVAIALDNTVGAGTHWGATLIGA